jgi:hypothetical protein
MKLPNLDLKEDQEKYESKSFAKEVKFKSCPHKEVSFNESRTELMCKCGASWSGSRMGELARLLSIDRIKK